ncbi:RhoGAP-domain-containing protein [Saccharata proteae CBS 121410]|uniref:RhoGAP-domain-containing protein n=1 Tax=Saccharata proteae CBS 121410 TaxID=1314787 RepID=A0A6A5YCF4_9PEZI|nr:RhoGAP-domain-containing protein [Saccharata proteae CBS 121410]
MESPGPYPESPMNEMDDLDVVYHCKGCGEILEEGKAFELAGNRWHIDCFRCNTCGTLLDSDANLLLLGDGSLICNNCTYSCSACGNKIEDLAILTGDQAFCASCFRCRNCKRKIENLRYARTSQGIFCMSCHESLMARRRKKSKANRQQPPSNTNGSAPIVLDKSLPALPPSALPQSAFTPDLETPPESYTETPPDVSPRLQAKSRRRDRSADLRREASPASSESHHGNDTLPATTYREKRRSEMPSSLHDGADDGLFVPFALDPNPAPGPSPLVDNRKYGGNTTAGAERSQRDYFTGASGRLASTSSSHRELLKDSEASSSRSSSRERRSKAASSPHIAYQEKGRQPSAERIDRSRREPSPAVSHDRQPPIQHVSSPSAGPALGEGFKLQEVPKTKKSSSRRGSRSEVRSLDEVRSSRELPRRNEVSRSESSQITSPVSTNSSYTPTSQDYERGDELHSLAAAFKTSQGLDRPKRGDSLGAPSMQPQSQTIPRKEVPTPHSPSTPTGPSRDQLDRKPSVATSNGGLSISNPVESPTSRSILDGPPPRAASRPTHHETTTQIHNAPSDSFTAPRAPPPPPEHRGHHKGSASVSTISEPTQPISPTLLRYSAGGDFSLDEDLARILQSEDMMGNEGSVLRRVSNAVKHGRSFSDRGSRSSLSAKWRSPANGSTDLSSPTSASPSMPHDPVTMRRNLLAAEQRNAILEAELAVLRESVNRSSDIKQVNTELREKRSTIAILDTQREMVMRELDIMTDHLKASKERGRPLALQEFKSEFLKDFATSLESLKSKLGNQIEDLIQKRNEINDEIRNLIQMKDKGYMEYESLSTKNAQLAELNQQLVTNIQTLYKSSRYPNGHTVEGGRPTNGLGIYTHSKERSDVSMTEIRNAVNHENLHNIPDHDVEPKILEAPKVVDIRKTKPNKFNWKKGGQAVAKNVTKGLKGAFASTNEPVREGQYSVQGVPYGSLPSTTEASAASSMPKSGNDPSRAGFGFFGGAGQKGGQPNVRAPPARPAQHGHNNSNTNLSASDNLFGSDLQDRCDYEKSTIPSIVRRCIQEVELRGMDVEGIYRKSGGSNQVNGVRAGFERDPEYDISDPDLDIHSVTSALKQYFRRLPNPLITFEVYDDLLGAGQLPDLDKKIAYMAAAVNNLPSHHRDCLEFLIFHLARVMLRESENLMTPLNLAVVFAPTVMRPQAIEREITDMQAQRMAMQSLLEHNVAIFTSDQNQQAQQQAQPQLNQI